MEAEAAAEAAHARLVAELRHPDDLAARLPQLRARAAADRAQVDAQMRTLLDEQLADARRGVAALLRARSAAAAVRADLSAAHALGDAAGGQIANYEKIKKISRTHQNFLATKDVVQQFQQLQSRVEELQGLLREDTERHGSENLLHVHYQLQQLEGFRNVTLERARGAGSDVQASLQTLFKPLAALAAAFEAHLWDLARATLELVKTRQFSTIIRVTKIVEAEERADELASLVEPMALGSAADDPDRLALATRQIKSYRIKFFDVLREAIG
ncbi:SNARE-binding exocyst subunit S6, partial [Cladochytrium tenue]